MNVNLISGCKIQTTQAMSSECIHQAATRVHVSSSSAGFTSTSSSTNGTNLCACLDFQSLTAALIASSANMLQCSFTGGNFKCAAMSEFFKVNASSIFFPLTHSVATELLAMADPHPNVLNLDSKIVPFASTLICSFMTSPQAGAPTRPCVKTIEIIITVRIHSDTTVNQCQSTIESALPSVAHI